MNQLIKISMGFCLTIPIVCNIMSLFVTELPDNITILISSLSFLVYALIFPCQQSVTNKMTLQDIILILIILIPIMAILACVIPLQINIILTISFIIFLSAYLPYFNYIISRKNTI